jgi:hypothetical protein
MFSSCTPVKVLRRYNNPLLLAKGLEFDWPSRNLRVKEKTL